MNTRKLAFGLCLLGFANFAWSQEQEFASLSPDHPCWATYSHSGRIKLAGSSTERSQGQTSIRFLRIESVDGIPHWWIETELSFQTDPVEISSLHRMLIPVATLRLGLDPVGHAKRALFDHSQKRPSGAIELNIDGQWNKPWFTRSLIHLDQEVAPEQSGREFVETSVGKFECDVYEFVGKRKLKDSVMLIQHRFWISEKVPTKIVRWELESDRTENSKATSKTDSMKFSFKLKAFGKDPKPKILVIGDD